MSLYTFFSFWRAQRCVESPLPSTFIYALFSNAKYGVYEWWLLKIIAHTIPLSRFIDIGAKHNFLTIAPPPKYFANQKIFKSLKITAYKLVYSNKDKIGF